MQQGLAMISLPLHVQRTIAIKSSVPQKRWQLGPRRVVPKPRSIAMSSDLSFAPYANWVLPGQTLQGEYPGQGPDICSSESEARARLRKILGEGRVTTFVSFLHELSAQEDVPDEGHNGFYPYRALSLDVLAELHIDRQLHFLRMPFVIDKQLSMDRMLELTAELESRVGAGEALYLHCSGGRGRAGTAAACLYARITGCSPAEALAHIQAAYDTRGQGLDSPASERQRVFIRDFTQQLRGAEG